MRLKRLRNVQRHELAQIEAPAFAASRVEAALEFCPAGEILDLVDEPALAPSWDAHDPDRDRRALRRLRGLVARGEVVLIHPPGRSPFAPVARWDEVGGRWVVDGGHSGGDAVALARIVAAATQLRGGLSGSPDIPDEVYSEHEVVDAEAVGAEESVASESDSSAPAASDSAEVQPCAFESIVIACDHGDNRRGKQWTFEWDGQIRDNLTVGGYATPITTNLQVTAGCTAKGADKLAVEVKGGPGYGCDATHPHIVLVDRKTNEIIEDKQGETKVELPVESRFVEEPAALWLNLAAVLSYYWFSPKGLRKYTLRVASCGRLDDGTTSGFRYLSKTIDAYSSDTFKLTVALPAAIAKQHKQGKVFNLENAQERTAYQSDKPVKAVATDVAKSFTFERNGEDFSGKLEIGKLIDNLIAVRHGIARVMDGVQGLTVGVKPICEVEFFSGQLSVEWGYKEWSDQRVFKWWKVEAALTILKATIGIGYGVEFFKGRWYEVTVLVKGTITGEIPLKVSKEANPDRDEGAKVTVEGKVTGAITATGQLGDKWLAVEGVVEAAIATEAAFEFGDGAPPGLDWKVHWTGLKVKGDVHSKIWGVATSVEHTLIKGKVLGEGTLFAGT